MTITKHHGSLDCSQVRISGINKPTWDNQCHFNQLFGSVGRATGGTISDAGSQTVNVSAGTGFIRATDVDASDLLSFDWVETASPVSVPTGEILYIGVKYNSGTPIVDSRTSQDWDYDTEFPLGSVINMNDELHILNNPWWVTDGITNLIEKSQGLGGYLARDNFVGGLTLGVTATRYPTMTAGTIWGRVNEFEMPSIDLSAPTVTAHSAVFDVDNGDGKGTITASSGTPYSKLHGGQRLIITGTGDNDGTYRVDSVAGENVITMEGVIAGTDGTEANTVIQETFATYWFESDGTVHETTALTQYPVTHWNDLSGAGVLDTVANNKYYVWWVIISATSNELAFIYPSSEHLSSARAEAEAVPSHIPGIWYLEGMIIGRIIIKANVDTPVGVQSVFETTFTASLAADHGNLTGLGDDDHPQYAKVAGQIFTGDISATNLSNTNSGDQASSDFTHNDLTGLNDGTDYEHITQTQKTALHAAVSVTDSAEIDFTLTGQDITADIKASSIDETKLDASVNSSLDLADSSIQEETDPVYSASQAANIDAGDITNLSNLSGSNSGDNTVCTSGAATTAETLKTARTIAGVSFNGSANISLNNNAITNGAGYTSNDSGVTSVAGGTGLTSTGGDTPSLSHDSHTGEVTGSTALTIADNIVDEANLKISNAPTDEYVLKADSAVTGGMKWGGIAIDDIFYENAQTTPGSSYTYTVAATRNAMTAGPFTIATGDTITVAVGATWVIV